MTSAACAEVDLGFDLERATTSRPMLLGIRDPEYQRGDLRRAEFVGLEYRFSAVGIGREAACCGGRARSLAPPDRRDLAHGWKIPALDDGSATEGAARGDDASSAQSHRGAPSE